MIEEGRVIYVLNQHFFEAGYVIERNLHIISARKAENRAYTVPLRTMTMAEERQATILGIARDLGLRLASQSKGFEVNNEHQGRKKGGQAEGSKVPYA